MKFDTTVNGIYPNTSNQRSLVSGSTTSVLTPRQKFLTVLVAVLSSFAVGAIPVVYAFTVTPTHNQAPAETSFPRGEMF